MVEIWLNWIHMASAESYICSCVCWGKRSVHSDGVCAQCLLFTGPSLPPHLPSRLRSFPYRIPTTPVCSERRWVKGERGGGAPPLMFSLGTGCCLFDFQSKQHKRLQYKQIVQCCPVEQRSRAEEQWWWAVCRSLRGWGRLTGAMLDQGNTNKFISKSACKIHIFGSCVCVKAGEINVIKVK